MFDDINNVKLILIFDQAKQNDKIPVSLLPDILDIFYVQIIVPYENRDLCDEEIEKILENYKCAYEELSVS